MTAGLFPPCLVEHVCGYSLKLHTDRTHVQEKRGLLVAGATLHTPGDEVHQLTHVDDIRRKRELRHNRGARRRCCRLRVRPHEIPSNAVRCHAAATDVKGQSTKSLRDRGARLGPRRVNCAGDRGSLKGKS